MPTTAIKYHDIISTVMVLLLCILAITAMFSNQSVSTVSHSGILGRTKPSEMAQISFTWQNVLTLFAVGLVASTIGGLLGMGGGVLKVSGLLLVMGLNPDISKFAALFSFFVMSACASWRYARYKLVMREVVKTMIPACIAGILVGGITGFYFTREVMLFFLGMFLLFIGIMMLNKIVCKNEEKNTVANGQPGLAGQYFTKDWHIILPGFLGGFFSCLLGISGGIVITPLQHSLGKIPLKNAIANTLLLTAIITPIACVVIFLLGWSRGDFATETSFLTTLCLLPGAVIGSQLGPIINNKMTYKSIYLFFAIFSLALGIYMLFFAR